MQPNFEHAIELISSLPNDEFARFESWFEEQKRNKVQFDNKKAQAKHQLSHYQKAKRWIRENGEDYLNQWVCLEGDKLIAFGENGLEVHQKAKEAGIQSPFLHHIVKDEKFFVGGWL